MANRGTELLGYTPASVLLFFINPQSFSFVVHKRNPVVCPHFALQVLWRRKSHTIFASEIKT